VNDRRYRAARYPGCGTTATGDGEVSAPSGRGSGHQLLTDWDPELVKRPCWGSTGELRQLRKAAAFEGNAIQTGRSVWRGRCPEFRRRALPMLPGWPAKRAWLSTYGPRVRASGGITVSDQTAGASRRLLLHFADQRRAHAMRTRHLTMLHDSGGAPHQAGTASAPRPRVGE